MQASGMNYAPKAKGKTKAIVGPGEFVFAATALEHGHIYGMCNGLTEAGAELKWVFDPDAAKVEAFRKLFPQALVAECEAQILEDQSVRLVAAAAVPCDRCDLGLRVMSHGKDYFTDKTPFTTEEQLARARAAAEETGRKYYVYFSERLHVEGAVYAGQLVGDGRIGRA